MGNPLKLRTARTLHDKLSDYKLRVDRVFGDYDPGEDSHEANVQRALENALDQTEALIGHLAKPRRMPKPDSDGKAGDRGE
jgi:hypothetical protein